VCLRVRQVRGLWYKSTNIDAPYNRAQILTPPATEHRFSRPLQQSTNSHAPCVSICALVPAAEKEAATSVLCVCARSEDCGTKAQILSVFVLLYQQLKRGRHECVCVCARSVSGQRTQALIIRGFGM
jgi:hypothetical protein